MLLDNTQNEIKMTLDQYLWRNSLRKCPITEEDLKDMGIWQNKDIQRKQLYRYNERKDCVLIQGAGFKYKNKVFLTLGIGSINILEAFSQFNQVDGIIGTGNALFLSKDFKKAYSCLTYDETVKRFEIDKTNRTLKYAEGGEIGPLIILNRVFMDKQEFIETKKKKLETIAFDLGNTFFTKPLPYSGRIKSRLRSKFVNTTRTVHCVHHPTLMEKELFFDSQEEIYKTVSEYEGSFMLGYTHFSDTFANSVGMVDNFRLDIKNNPSEITSFTILKLVEQFYR